MGILALIAEFENDIRRERQMDGIAKARERGVRFGRKPLLVAEMIQRVRYHIAHPSTVAHSMCSLAIFICARRTLGGCPLVGRVKCGLGRLLNTGTAFFITSRRFCGRRNGVRWKKTLPSATYWVNK
jgi:hypothetical protein